jgi:ubiquinone/menaquinone biosynthesis C-methylase UbiE
MQTLPHPIMGQSAKPLMALVAGFWAAKTLGVAHELDLFSHVSSKNSISVGECAAHYGLAERPADMLLTACAALGLLQRHGERYGNSAMADMHLVKGKPMYIGGWVAMANRREYPAWMHLKDALYANRPLTWDPDHQSSLFDSDDSVLKDIFWEAMYALSITTSWTLAETIDWSGVKKLLDVGGGGAANDITLCERHPRLRATVYDLPFVCQLTRKKIEAAGLSERIGLAEGDFFADPALPGGHDAILLSKILLDWSEDDCQSIIAKCFSALPSGGRVVICDLLVDDSKDGPVDAALMSLNMLIETWGRNYTAAEYASWLNKAGFVRIETHRFDAPGANGVVVGYRA